MFFFFFPTVCLINDSRSVNCGFYNLTTCDVCRKCTTHSSSFTVASRSLMSFIGIWTAVIWYDMTCCAMLPLLAPHGRTEWHGYYSFSSLRGRSGLRNTKTTWQVQPSRPSPPDSVKRPKCPVSESALNLPTIRAPEAVTWVQRKSTSPMEWPHEWHTLERKVFFGYEESWKSSSSLISMWRNSFQIK
jgi:hypothetical protein